MASETVESVAEPETGDFEPAELRRPPWRPTGSYLRDVEAINARPQLASDGHPVLRALWTDRWAVALGVLMMLWLPIGFLLTALERVTLFAPPDQVPLVQEQQVQQPLQEVTPEDQRQQQQQQQQRQLPGPEDQQQQQQQQQQVPFPNDANVEDLQQRLQRLLDEAVKGGPQIEPSDPAPQDAPANDPAPATQTDGTTAD